MRTLTTEEINTFDAEFAEAKFKQLYIRIKNYVSIGEDIIPIGEEEEQDIEWVNYHMKKEKTKTTLMYANTLWKKYDQFSHREGHKGAPCRCSEASAIKTHWKEYK